MVDRDADDCSLFDDDIGSRWRIVISTAAVIALSGFLAESFGRSVRNAQVISTSLGIIVFVVQVLGYVLRAEYQPKTAPVEANKQTMFTRRNYWKFAIASATLLAITDVARRVERIGTKRALDLSLTVHAQAATAIRELIQKKQTDEDVRHLKLLADSSVRFFPGKANPPLVIDAALTAHAALIASQIPPVFPYRIININFDLRGTVWAAVKAEYELFLAHVRIFSSVPNRSLFGVVVLNHPRVVAYAVELDGLTQAIDGIF